MDLQERALFLMTLRIAVDLMQQLSNLVKVLRVLTIVPRRHQAASFYDHSLLRGYKPRAEKPHPAQKGKGRNKTRLCCES